MTCRKTTPDYPAKAIDWVRSIPALQMGREPYPDLAWPLAGQEADGGNG
jgi:hypothetical protein